VDILDAMVTLPARGNDVNTDDMNGAGIGASIVAIDTAAEPTVVLTYDDGPEPGGTDSVLDVLADAGATATFFVLMSRVRRHASLFDELLASGHEIALHGPDHRRLTELDPKQLALRTRTAKEELEDRTGRAVRWFRPPYGDQSTVTWGAVADAGLTTVLWSADCLDWLDAPHDDRLRKTRAMAEPGAVLLLHDGFASAMDGVDDGEPPAIDRGKLSRSVIEICAGKGFACSSLGQALDAGHRAEWARLDD
jgi:peptidoglycan/xylan/chitin deacetylase (PgdA/CDA1 family)